MFTFLWGQVRKYLIPDSNDQIRQQQMREIQVGKLLVELMEDKTGASNKPLSLYMSSYIPCIFVCPHIYVLIFR